MIKQGEIHYLTHQISKTKTAPPKWTNFGRWKPHPTKNYATKQPSTNTRTKVDFKKFKENFKQ